MEAEAAIRSVAFPERVLCRSGQAGNGTKCARAAGFFGLWSRCASRTLLVRAVGRALREPAAIVGLRDEHRHIHIERLARKDRDRRNTGRRWRAARKRQPHRSAPAIAEAAKRCAEFRSGKVAVVKLWAD